MSASRYSELAEGLWLPDYALIELEASRFGHEYSGLTNLVFVDNLSEDQMTAINRELGFPDDQLELPTETFLRLDGIIPVRELMDPNVGGEFEGDTVLNVGKRGRTGLT